MATFDDLDSAVARGEITAGLADPGGSDQDSLGCVLVVHHACESVDGLEPDDLAVTLGLDDADAADSFVTRGLGDPCLHADRLEKLADEVLELDRLQRQQ